MTKARIKIDDLVWHPHPVLAAHEQVLVNGFSLVRGPFTLGRIDVASASGDLYHKLTPEKAEEIINGPDAD